MKVKLLSHPIIPAAMRIVRNIFEEDDIFLKFKVIPSCLRAGFYHLVVPRKNP